MCKEFILLNIKYNIFTKINVYDTLMVIERGGKFEGFL